MRITTRLSRNITCIVLLLILFLLLFLNDDMHINSVSAQSDTPQSPSCNKEQVVILIDQSTSMQARNDPNQLRFYAPVYLADVMGRNYITAKKSQDKLHIPVSYELAVVEFATRATVALPWTVIAPANDEAWKEQREQISKEVDEEAYQDLKHDIGNGTNFIEAFSVAEELFNDKDVQKDGCPLRKIILVTDGMPDKLGEPLNTNDLEIHMGEVEKIVSRSLRGSGNEIYITGINVSGDRYWEKTVCYWRDIIGEQNFDECQQNTEVENPLIPPLSEKVPNQSKLGVRLAKIFIKSFIDIQPGNIVVPPYVDRLIFTFYKSDASNIISLQDSFGEINEDRRDIEVIIHGEEDAIQTLEIIRPFPGTYQLATTATRDDYVITQQIIFVKAILQPHKTTYQQFTTFPITINLEDSEGNPLPDYGEERYKLQVNSQIESNDRTWPVTLALLEPSVLSGQFTPILSDDHLLSIQAFAIDDTGKKWEIIAENAASYSILVDPVEVMIKDPQNSVEKCPLAQGVPFVIPIQLMNVSTQKPVIPSLPINFDATTSNQAAIQISDIDNEGLYSISVNSEEAGKLSIDLSASVPDPIDGTFEKYHQTQIHYSLEKSEKYTLSIEDVGPEADMISTWIQSHIDQLLGKPVAEHYVIGRKFLFFPQNVIIHIRLINQENPVSNDASDLMPEISILSQSHQLIPVECEQDTDEAFSCEFKGSKTGEVYFVEIGHVSLPCNVQLKTVNTNEDIHFTLGIVSWILLLLIIIAILAILLSIIKWLLCKYINPLEGVLGIVNIDGHTVWFNPINDKSCFRFKIKNSASTCDVVEIRVCGVFQSRGFAKITVFRRKFTKTKGNSIRVGIEKTSRTISMDDEISLPNGSRILWRKLLDFLPKVQ